MESYRVEFIWKGNRYTELVGAASSDLARRLVVSRYPGCSIWNVARV